MENRFKLSGVAFTLYGFVAAVSFVGFYIFGATQLSSLDNMPLLLLFIINLLFAINLLSLLCGIYLLKQNEAVHKLALPVSILILLSVPFGTIVGGIYLIQRYKHLV